MAEEFKVRRDSSTNNVPTVGYNEGVDAQDVILFGACKVIETLNVNGIGDIELSYCPVSLSGQTFSDVSGTRRGRNFNDDIKIKSVNDNTTYYAGTVDSIKKKLKVYTNQDRTILLSGTIVSVEYYKRIPIKVNSDGELVAGQDKNNVLLKKEITLASGASANVLDVTIGDSSKDMYLTSAIAYYDGTGSESDPYLSFWFDVMNSAGSSTYSLMDMPLPPKTKAPMQIDFGQAGIKVPAGSKLRFRVNANFTTNKIHAMAFGYQYN